MKISKITRDILVSITVFFLVMPSPLVAAGMNDYCLMPPYIKSEVSPNVVILMDNSKDMLKSAYIKAEKNYNDDPASTYDGYFVNEKYYEYGSNKFEISTKISPNPGANTAATVIAADNTVLYRGSLLNWATTSRYDILMKVLIGGKATSRQSNDHTLESVSDKWNKTYQGCKFSVSGAQLTISDDGGHTCHLLDSTPTAIASRSSIGSFFARIFGRTAPTAATAKNSGIRPFFTQAFNDFIKDAEAAAPKPVAVDTAKIPDSTVDQAYTLTIPAKDGTTPYTWADRTAFISDIGVTFDDGANTITTTSADFTSAAPNNFQVYDLINIVGTGLDKKNKGAFIITAVLPNKFTVTDSNSGNPALANETKTVTISSGSTQLKAPLGLPPGLILSQSDNDYVLSGTPTSAACTTSPCTSCPCDFSFTIQVKDSSSGTVPDKYDWVNFTITVKPAPDRTPIGPLKVRIVPEGGAGTEQKGLIQEFLGQARWALADFRKGKLYIEQEIAERTTSSDIASFVTDIQNIGAQNKAPLAKGYYGVLKYYAYDTALKGTAWDAAPGKDPFEDDTIPCRKNFVLSLSSVKNVKGKTADNDFITEQAKSCVDQYTYFDKNNTEKTKTDADKQPLITYSCYGYLNDLRTDKDGKQNVYHYGVYTFGDSDDPADSDEEDTNLGCLDITDPDYDPSLCDPEETVSPRARNKAILQAATLAGGGKQESRNQFYDATSGNLTDSIRQAIMDILRRAASGTAASVLASGEGSGANLIQAVFYPRRKFYNSATANYDEISWIGRLSNLWYYVDPFFANSNIREDDGDKILALKADDSGSRKDFIAQLFFDSSAELTKAHRWEDDDGDGDIDTQLADVEFEKLGVLWEAGLELWKRDLSSSARTIKTTTGSGLIDFSTANAATLASYLQAVDATEAQKIIRFIQGEDISGYRSRTVKVDLNNDGDTLDTNVGGYDETAARVWKLGDVLNSTPKISSWLPLNTYHKYYSDNTYGEPGKDPSLQNAADATHYITSTGYRGRGMIFTGANDGMLHAFKLGTLELKWSGQDETTYFEKARLTGSDLGKEMWAFIPKNALPYLKYAADPDYCHVYTIDLTPFVFDASINGASDATRSVSSWRTVLIGGMRYGGACKPKNTDCSTDTPNSVCAPAEVSGASIGYSSYFALDITDQNNPTLLWEYSHPELGFTTTGPAVVRISAKDGVTGDPLYDKNGYWFVVFGSGPTGPISTIDKQFLGKSDQKLKLFVLDLRDGALATPQPVDTGITEAFAGSMLNSTLDSDLDYQDDVVYIPYVKKDGTTWTQGGVGRLSTKENVSPAIWEWSTVMDNIGPVTSAAVKLQNNTTNTLWVYFGSGRYYFEQGSTADDASGQRHLFGIKEPCFISTGFQMDCTSSRSWAALTDVTDIEDVPDDPNASDFYGWFIALDPADGGSTPVYRAERVITDPLAATSGVVFFTTYKPYADQCARGGKSFIWAAKYNSGGAAGTLLKGKALIQVSTGSIEQKDLSQAFTEAGGRKSLGMEGVPPTSQGLSILSTPNPVKRIIHVKER